MPAVAPAAAGALAQAHALAPPLALRLPLSPPLLDLRRQARWLLHRQAVVDFRYEGRVEAHADQVLRLAGVAGRALSDDKFPYISHLEHERRHVVVQRPADRVRDRRKDFLHIVPSSAAFRHLVHRRELHRHVEGRAFNRFACGLQAVP
jgi:hypothetical protein